MRKKLVALICAIGLVAAPSLGVMAAEPVNDNIQNVQTQNNDQILEQDDVNTPDDQTKTNTDDGNDSSVNDKKENGINQNKDDKVHDAMTTPMFAASPVPASVAPAAKAQSSVSIAMKDTSLKLKDGEPYRGDSGEIIWNESARTLEFKNFKLQDDSTSSNIAITGDATIILSGENVISAENGEMLINARSLSDPSDKKDSTLNIQGEGSLSINAKSAGILTQDHSVNISGTTIALNSSASTPLESEEVRGIMAFQTDSQKKADINITDSTVTGKNMFIASVNFSDDLYPNCNISFNGKTNVTVEGMPGTPEVLANGRIIFALTKGGKVTVSSSDSGDILYPAVISLLGISLEKGNGIINPSEGKVVSTLIDDMEMYCIADKDGNPTGKATITVMEEEEKPSEPPQVNPPAESQTKPQAESQPNAVVKNVPKTGDYSQSSLWLSLLLVAACCVAVTTKVIKERA